MPAENTKSDPQPHHLSEEIKTHPNERKHNQRAPTKREGCADIVHRGEFPSYVALNALQREDECHDEDPRERNRLGHPETPLGFAIYIYTHESADE